MVGNLRVPIRFANFTSKIRQKGGIRQITVYEIMAKKSPTAEYTSIIADIRRQEFKPVYLLMGEEPYYIDLITDEIVKNALADSERDFNQTIVYGADTDMATILNAARRYPMMAQRQLVVVKELQQMRSIDELLYYMQNPQPTTVLVLNHKSGTFKNKKILAEANRLGLVFESKRIYDSQLPAFIADYVREKNLSIDDNAASMLGEAIGTNLSRLTSEIDKLGVLLSAAGQNRITADTVELHIGISKEFNNTELIKAVARRDLLRAGRIVQYYANTKSDQPFIAFSSLFSYFANLLLLHYSSCQKNAAGIASELGVNWYAADDYLQGLKTYKAGKCVEIISNIRRYDARSKGVECAPDTSLAELLQELLYKIMHN